MSIPSSMGQPILNKSVTTTVMHASLGSLSQGSSFASSGGSCCSSTRTILPAALYEKRDSGGTEELSDSVAPLKSARPTISGRGPLSSRGPLLAIDSPPNNVNQNGFYRTTTISVVNGAGLLSLGPEQKSRSLSNLEIKQQKQRATDNKRSPSPAPSRSSHCTSSVMPRLQRQHWKYGSLRHLPTGDNYSISRQASTTKELVDYPAESKLPNGLRFELGGSEEGKLTTYDSGAIPMINGRILAADRSYGRAEGSNDESVQEEDEDLLNEGEAASHRRLFPRHQEIIATESTRNSDIRLQQSLSTPNSANDPSVALLNGSNGGASVARKDSEYRRFRSEGSTTAPSGARTGELPVDLPLDSPIIDPRSSPPNRLNLFQQDTMVSNGGPLTKHSHTEQVMMGFVDKAFQLIEQGPDEQVFEGCTIATKVMTKAWVFPKISQDLAHSLCDYLREQNYLEVLLGLFTRPTISDSVRLCCGRVLEECLTGSNCDALIQKGFLKKVVTTAEKLNKNQEQQRMSLSLMEALFKHSTETTSKLIELERGNGRGESNILIFSMGVIDHILLTCKRATDTPGTLRHAALALSNLTLYSCQEAKKKLIQKKLPDWLFLLASQRDDITRYYACLAICVLGSASTNSKEMELAVAKSGTLTLVEPFLISHQPAVFAQEDYKNSQGRPREWLARLLPLLGSRCREAKSMASFHLCVEAITKKEQQKLEVLAEIGAIQALKECASSPDELPAKFASEALTVIGEQVPYKLSQQVPCWSIKDVQYWVEKIGFGTYSQAFAAHMVDGDLLLLLTEKELEEDLGMRSGLLRKRFMRELESLKIAADYGFLFTPIKCWEWV
uniref:ADP-ribosyl cyclase/cyclic ADP-ribose hydrolase n=1 Tax=Meloidogyne hapla TaxID=6305 RepID=A0A1I8BSL5_MELHA